MWLSMQHSSYGKCFPEGVNRKMFSVMTVPSLLTTPHLVGSLLLSRQSPVTASWGLLRLFPAVLVSPT